MYNLHSLQLQSKLQLLISPLKLFGVRGPFMDDDIVCHILDPSNRILSIAYPNGFHFGAKYSCSYGDGRVYPSQ